MITIVLLIKNAGKKLVHTLDGIFNQVCDLDYEVLAIDSGSTDCSLEILSKYPLRILQISPENFNHGETRNLGASESSKRSDYIVYLTQDAVPYDSQWLQNLIMPMKKDVLVAGAFSRHIPHPTSSPALVRQLTTWWQSGGRNRIIKEMPAGIEEFEKNKSFYIYFSNTSSIIRKSVWEVNPWKKVDFAEDAVWADEVLRAGYKIVFEPNSKILSWNSL